MSKPAYNVRVISVKHYTDHLFSFKTTRPQDLIFQAGQFIMLGLESHDGSPAVMRAYSIASGPYDEELEFYSIKVPNGLLTSRLQKIKAGSEILLSKKPVGNMTIWDVQNGARLFMFSTGTGIAPFVSMIRDPATFERFGQVILTHTCRKKKDLQYGFEIIEKLHNDHVFSELIKNKLVYYPSVTRDVYNNTGRITKLIKSSKLFSDLKISPIDFKTAREMICGSTEVVNDMKEIMLEANMKQSCRQNLNHFTYERAFVG